MNLLSRAMALVFGVASMAAIVTVGVLVWDQSKSLQSEWSTLPASFDIVLADRSEQLLATAVLIALALPALALLAYALRGPDHGHVHAPSDVTNLDSRVTALEQRVDAAPPVRAVEVENDAPRTHTQREPRAGRRWRLIPRTHQ